MSDPLIPWPGGKRKLARHILPHMPSHECYVEAFAGGAGILFSRGTPAPVEVLNDINGDLVRLYRCVQHHLEELLRQFKWALVSRQMFEWIQMQRPETLTDIQRAARFFYLQKLAFGAKVSGQNFGTVATGAGPRLNLLRLEEDLSAAHLRLARVIIENLSWPDCLTRYDRPETFFYLDPPYWQTEGYGVEFGFEHYELLAERMRSLQGKALISINDHPDIRRVFAGFDMVPLQVRYTIGKEGRSEPAGELLIKSWDDRQAQLL